MSEQAWDTHPAAFRILPSFQQHAPNPHEHWRFLRSEGRDKNRARWTVPKERSVVSLTARFINNRCVELLGSRNVNMNGPRLLTSICPYSNGQNQCAVITSLENSNIAGLHFCISFGGVHENRLASGALTKSFRILAPAK